ncbi:hypothetical protein [Leptolyngbya sp. FACHB-671]|uniref:hypothetical protein n=1 Tax=Leptolyngbya sp. FACHB-671 TaxID=2692812 RepID=UPI0016824BA7|nr:hypothetical protein [Leptolyngbya sp. FACHB-671]
MYWSMFLSTHTLREIVIGVVPLFTYSSSLLLSIQNLDELWFRAGFVASDLPVRKGIGKLWRLGGRSLCYLNRPFT